MDIKYGAVLLLTLAASVCGLAVEVRNTAPIVQGWKGDDIRLPCNFEGEPEAVNWVKESSSREQRRTTKARFFDGIFKSWEKGFDIVKNFSLVITDLEVADEGLYLCQVVLTNLEDFELSNFLTVSSMASDHTIKECVDKTQSSQNGCTYQIITPSTTTFNLTCVVSGFKPNISMLWTEESGKRLNSVVSRQKMLSDSTYERSETISISTEQGKEQTFMCIATGDSLNGTSTKEITLLPISEKRDNNVEFIVGLVIGVSVAVSILFLLVGKFLQKYHPQFLPRKGCGWNPCCRRPKRVDEEETLMLAPLSPSLTKEQVQQIKEDLKAYYLLSRRKVTVDPLNFMDNVNLDAIYTNLSLLDLGDVRKASPLTYENLVTNDRSSSLSKRLLIQGEGGVGKTTLCSKIAWDWCQGRILQDLDMVLVISLRDVTDGKSIGSIVHTYLSDSNVATQDQIDGYISNNSNKIFIVFDGFDEFNGKIEEKSSSEVIRILGLEQHKSCKVIVTTRPWRRHEFTVVKRIAEAYTFIRVDGFNKDNLSLYIKKYFLIRQKNTLAEDLITFMEENEVIQSNMAPFPIYCAMLCLMWEKFSKERRKEMTKMQTFSEIFGEMISFLEEHYASKACQNVKSKDALEHLKEADRAIQDISEIALTGLLQNNMTFPEDQFRECPDTLETCCRVGVLTIEKDVINRGRRRNVNIQSLVLSTVSFPHKLFQEYIANAYIENVYASNRADYSQLKNKLLAQFEQFRYLLYFISTLRNEIHLDIIDGLTKCADQYFCVDVAFECHTEEAARAVGERWNKYRLSPDMSEHTKSGVVFMVHCNQARSLHIDRCNCGRTLLLDLAEGMSSSTVMREVTMDLFNSKFETDFYKIVADKASTCQIRDLALTISFWNDNLQYPSSMGKHLARWVCTMPRLSTFSVRCHNLPNGFFSTAADMAQSCQVSELLIMIDSGHISESEATAAAEFLCHMPHLRRARITCDNLPRTFFTTIDSQTSTCTKQIEGIIINDKPLHQLPSDKHESTSQQDDCIKSADGTGFPPLELSTTHDHSTVTEDVEDHDADSKISSENRQTYFYTAIRLDDDE